MRAGTWEDNVSDNILIALTVLLCVIGGLALRADFRTRTQAWLASRGEAVTTAASIAALIGNRPADDVQQIALRRLRCIRLDLISVDELASPQPDPLLFNKSSRCQLGQIDAFISHSWRDDPHEKWAMMQAWRARFKAEHSREPLVWLDKACIEQGDIDANLMCLPVFLAGCSTLLVVYGPTYLSRVWCVTELFTFLQMGASADRIELLLPGPPGPSSPGSAELAVLTAPAASCAAGTPRLPLRSPSPSKSQSVAGEATIASHYSVEGILGKAAARLSMGGNRQSGGFARASTARGSNGSLAVRVSDMTAGSR
ncbi:hypothetical protein KFE25_014306 [Diacronema lutheri]|uniref:TIR domain-containing protein n=1 Tax=Diacronema lutheri TaxID=2081491 RepID=A0A8J6C6J2_DIALT|nr:hypothetical protein KFE25_014306 [Diacronema lutheri]